MSGDYLQKSPSLLMKTERELKKIEHEIEVECANVVFSSTSHAFDVDPEKPKEIPPEWLEELQVCQTEEERAAKRRELDRRFRIAKYALMPNKDVPVAITIAAKVLSGMHKANAMKDAAPRALNLTMVSISSPNQPIPVFPEKEVKHE